MPRGTCWYGYEQKGFKKKGNRSVPNCVKKAAQGKFIKNITPKQRLENLKKGRATTKEEKNIRQEYDIIKEMQDMNREQDDFERFKEFRENLIDKKKGLLIKEGGNVRIPRKPGQPAGSKKHSDLYTDENPKGTIQGLKFATEADARKSVSKIRGSGRSHAHKVQAAVAMEQRASVMGKAGAAGVYRNYIDSVKKTKKNDGGFINMTKDLNYYKGILWTGEIL